MRALSLLMAGCCIAAMTVCAGPSDAAPGGPAARKERAQVLNGIVASVKLPVAAGSQGALIVTDEAGNDIEFMLRSGAYAFDAARRKLVKLKDLDSGTRVRVSFETLRTGDIVASSIKIVGARSKWER